MHLATIAETARDVDFAMRWGFGMKQGPFELWQEAGWLQVAQWIQEDIDAGKALSKAPLPEWVFKGPVAEAGGVHTPEGSWNPTAQASSSRAALLPVHARQLFPETVLGSDAPRFETAGTTLHEDGDIRLWTLDDEVLIASIKTKMHAISPEVCRRPAAGGRAGREGLPGPGDLVGRRAVLASAPTCRPCCRPSWPWASARSRTPKASCSRPCCGCATPACRWCRPSAAWRWAAAASWRCIRRRRVAAMESYIGLVEVGVGLVPGAGGLTYIARRAAENAAPVDATRTCCRS